MGKYEVTAESVVTHTVVVEAENEDEAALAYEIPANWEQDLGEVFDDEKVVSVMEVGE